MWEGLAGRAAMHTGMGKQEKATSGIAQIWGSAVAVLAGCEKCLISSLQHCPRLDVPPKETAGSTFMPQRAKTRELKCDKVNRLETVVCEKKEKNGSCFT